MNIDYQVHLIWCTPFASLVILKLYKLCDKNPFIKKVSFSPYYGTGNTSQLTPAQRQSLDSGFKKSSSHFHTLNINPPKNSEILPLPLS
jgi:hypothetical protein